MGRTLADLANFSFADASDEELKSIRAGLLPLETVLSINEERLRRGAVRTRLGARLADVLRCQLNENSARLSALDHPTSLAHGDFSGRNILVAPADESNWRIAGLIDWETAFSGSALWDIGSLFRYAKRYSETFRRSFERSYNEAGGTLPRDWWRIARLLDATKLVAILNEERELPIVFAECRELIEAVVAGG